MARPGPAPGSASGTARSRRGSAAGWRVPREPAGHDRRLDADRIDELPARAHWRIDTLEELRMRTATEIFNQRRSS
jgi:hypothetical protein